MKIRSLYDDERAKMLADRACGYCGSAERLTIDHLIPRILGGCDDGGNLILACKRCNSAKRDADLIEWYERRGEFPPLMLLRRYLKIVFEYCDNAGVMGCGIEEEDLINLPFRISSLPKNYPPLAKMRL